MKDLYHTFKEVLFRSKLVSPGASILLMLSAGKDSMALLHLMSRAASELPLSMAAFHLNHMTRGAESDADAAFVAENVARMNLPFHLRVHDFGTAGNFEERAREARYGYAREIQQENGVSLLASAHTKNDLGETVLMRLFTGTSYAGLNPILHDQGGMIRPLLHFSSEEIIAYLRENRISWREDQTNQDTGYTRNYLRHRVIPVIQERFPNALDAIEGLAGTVEELIRDLDQIVDQYVTHNGDVTVINEALMYRRSLFFFALSRELKRRYGYLLNRARLDDILNKYQNSSRGNIVLYRTGEFSVLVESRRDGRSVVIAPVADHLPDIEDIRLSDIPIGGMQLRGMRIRLMNADELVSPDFSDRSIQYLAADEIDAITVRSRRQGDVICTEGKTIAIKELLINEKIPPREKPMVPVVEVAGTVIAVLIGVAGYGRNRVKDDFKVTKRSKKILALGRT